MAGRSAAAEAARPTGRRRRGRSLLDVRSVVGQMFVLQLVVVLLLTAGAVVLILVTARQESTRDGASTSLAVAQGFASAPGTAAAVDSPNPTRALQSRAEEARKGAGVDYVVVLNRAGIRLTHPLANRIGKRTSTDMVPLLAGETVVEEREGTLGPQIRAYVPLRRPDGTVVGAVGSGVTIDRIHSAAAAKLPTVLGAGAGALALFSAGAALLSRRLLRQTHGLGPTEITRLYEHHDTVLHAVREGVVILDGRGRLMLANDEANRLLGLPPDAQGRAVSDLGLPPATVDLLESEREVTDGVHRTGSRILAVNQRPTGAFGGRVITLRDTTELLALSRAAEVTRQRLKVLYDASLDIGTTLEVPRTARELARTVVPDFADYATVDLVEPVLHGDEVHGTERDLRRVAVVGVDDAAPLYGEGELIRLAPATPQARGLDLGHSVLEPRLADAPAWQAQDPERARAIVAFGIHSLITAPLKARGVVLGVASFWRSNKPEPFDAEDLALAGEVVARAAVCLDNARRYTHEHSTAVALQRSLMPRYLPAQDALETAYRYLPAHAGVGGDWFDIIPLPGARVALVAGDVVGHGLHAAATMGRLRTAVHNFSALDLPLDELLTHLDELVARMDQEQIPATGPQGGVGVTGATCLYAVYDSTTGRCAMARAGHPPLVVAHPDGTVHVPPGPVSPPLGTASGLPVEITDFAVPEGSRLILYTDGLIEDRHRDIDAGLALLTDTLREAPDQSPEDTCETILTALLPEQPRDDIALLVARTRRLTADRSAAWDVPSDPAAVAVIRAQCARQLDAWGLTDLGFTTELILSELITNAVRYAAQPIHVRLIHDHALICEVSDGSSTAPHLRRAATTDEGGRGLFLVAQLADRWGTRYTPRGKVIWTEQSLHSEGPRTGADPTDALLDQWDLD
ncbi:SpoIIE family protein phosphatase [Streptomyces sp. NPDC020965]|uniref:SpoIIE family protein phosphatase n=1 Tax=Streptomyces sp. NPDC020965 TaxID=3365105 RepID=UPI003791E24A